MKNGVHIPACSSDGGGVTDVTLALLYAHRCQLWIKISGETAHGNASFH
jgi:hypothetical protein